MGEIGYAGAEGATAPETLRQKDHDDHHFWKEARFASADGITLSGKKTEGVHGSEQPVGDVPMVKSDLGGSAERATEQPQVPISVADIFKIGIGPSSSHTIGPMCASLRFVEALGVDLPRCQSITVELFGSLALTGKGHSTDIAVLLGLSGCRPETVDPDLVPALVDHIRLHRQLFLAGVHPIAFDESANLIFRRGEFLPAHPNGMRLSARSSRSKLLEHVYYSIGGGAIVLEGEPCASMRNNQPPRYPFSSASELLAIGKREGLSIADIMLANERTWRAEIETDTLLDRISDAMMATIARGCRQEGILPGGLNLRRRAPRLLSDLSRRSMSDDALFALDWVSLYALAVNEENAAGGRIVTAPTNGAAGVVPAVLKYYETFCSASTRTGSRAFLLTAAAIGALYKRRASISAADMGCQGEIGVASSMAAAGLAAALGGTNEQIENAAEIGMEHNLGLTCDPVRGLVQVPCI